MAIAWAKYTKLPDSYSTRSNSWGHFFLDATFSLVLSRARWPLSFVVTGRAKSRYLTKKFQINFHA